MIKTWEDFEEMKGDLRDAYHSAEVPKTASENRESAQEEPWYHSVSIELLSGGGCTPDGILIKTAGMEADELKEWDLAQRPKKKKKNIDFSQLK
jgi:hypothetical protein